MSNLDATLGQAEPEPTSYAEPEAVGNADRAEPGRSRASSFAARRDAGSRVYLDHAATTTILPEALEAMVAELAHTGNPSSLHNAGRRARRVVEESREQIAEAFGARPSEVVFTSGGTEADNLAIKGLYWARQDGVRQDEVREGRAREDWVHQDSAHVAGDNRTTRPGGGRGSIQRPRVLATAIEHHAVLDCVGWLGEHQGAEVEWLEVDSTGLLSPDVLRDAIEQDPASVALASVMWANNEVGAIQPIAELAAVAREHGIPFHSDAVQAAGQLPVDLSRSRATALTITAHKIGGPVGVGALLLARGEDPVPVLHGGGQERDVRSGTLDAAAIRAFAVAVEHVVAERKEHVERIAQLRDDLIDRVRAAVPDAVLNGPEPGPRRLAGNAHFSFPGCEGDALLMLLDAKGIACSTGSACTAGVAQPSHVLLAMGADPSRARGSLRLSLGRTSTESDVDAFVDVIGEVVERARRAGR